VIRFNAGGTATRTPSSCTDTTILQ
jgi:hypothetical protein